MRNALFVVVVDDDDSVRKALARLLRAARMDVETFASGDGFLQSLGGRQPDCLILDIRMPGMTGPHLRDRLAALGYRIPIIFITAHAEDVSEDHGTEVVQILHKPFGDEALLNAIQRCVGRRDGPGPDRTTKAP
jgi:FixJ family two-component response regulator